MVRYWIFSPSLSHSLFTSAFRRKQFVDVSGFKRRNRLSELGEILVEKKRKPCSNSQVLLRMLNAARIAAAAYSQAPTKKEPRIAFPNTKTP